MASRVLRVTLTVAVRDMTEDEYEDAGGDSAEDLGLKPDDDPTDVVGWLEPYEFREIIADALDSEIHPELLAGSGLFITMGGVHVEAVEWAA